MIQNYLAHAGEVHETETESAWHVISSTQEPLIAITVVAIASIIIATRFLSAADNQDKPGGEDD